MKKKIVRNCISILLLLLLMSSCSTDYDVNYIYSVKCSEDLLEYVTPVVTITYTDGNTETIRLKDSDWNKSGISTVTVKTSSGSMSSTQNVSGYFWDKTIYYGEFGVRSSMEVRFERKVDAPQIDDNKIYVFSHGLSCTISAAKEKKGFKTEQSYNLNPDTSISYYVGMKGSSVEQYLNELLNTVDRKGGAVDDNGSIKRDSY